MYVYPANDSVITPWPDVFEGFIGEISSHLSRTTLVLHLSLICFRVTKSIMTMSVRGTDGRLSKKGNSGKIPANNNRVRGIFETIFSIVTTRCSKRKILELGKSCGYPDAYKQTCLNLLFHLITDCVKKPALNTRDKK